MSEKTLGNPKNVTRYIERFLDDDEMRQVLREALISHDSVDRLTIHQARHQIDNDFCHLKDPETPWQRQSIERITHLGRIANLETPSPEDIDSYFDAVKRHNIE